MVAMIPKCAFWALLAIHLTLGPVEARGGEEVLQRRRREWIAAPRKLKENHDYTGLESIARIRSDKENADRIVYSLSGPGVDQPPIGVFGVDSKTGFVKIYSTKLDREEIEFYHLIGKATYVNGQEAEKDIDLKITVLDDNDNAPVITVNQVGSVKESSQAGTYVMTVIGTDADKENTMNSMLEYSIVGSGAEFFTINGQTGQIMVRQSTLDRENQDTYKVMVQASDMRGQAGGNSGSGEVLIKILDINDNIPYLEKESYEGKIEENTVNTEVMRIQAIDMDLIHTDNWLAAYEIVSGNEGGYFTITTDKQTNEGIIMINKELDYEAVKVLNLGVAVSNKAAYSQTIAGSTSKIYPVKINVVNQKEGPRFQPSVKVVTISEDSSSVSINKVITTYTAIDSDTLKTATNVYYAKYRDEDNWLIVDRNTAEIKLNKMPDRESKYLRNGTYYAEIICITTDSPSKTATGTVAIQVEDFNDHCPELTATTQTMCFEENALFVTAVDKDEFPNSVPFDFQVVPEDTTGKWSVEHYNETTAILRDQEGLWPGIYKVKLMVKDQQGKFCTDLQVLDVVVCTCHDTTKTCLSRNKKTTEFGAPGILLMLLGLLLLLLLPCLLMFCLCGGGSGDFKAIPFDTKQQLMSYHTEGQGEDKEVPLLNIPGDGEVTTRNVENLQAGGRFDETYLGAGNFDGRYTMEGGTITNQYNKYQYAENLDYADGGMTSWQKGSGYRGGAFDGMALSSEFLGSYYFSKSEHASQQYQEKDNLEIFNYEGEGSLAGSVGCCSLLGQDDDLDFLNDLGPKFKMLAQICQGSSIVTESVKTSVSVPPPRPVAPVKLPSSQTHVHTHTERHTDRDRVNINTVNTSGVSTSTLSKVQVQDNVVIPSQTMLIQQPAMYYAATPMYVVESNPQMMLVAGNQAMGQVASVGVPQGLVQMGGIQGSQGVVLVDRQVGTGGVVAQGSQGVVLVDRQAGRGGVVAQGSQGVVLVDRQVGVGGTVVQGTQGRSRGTTTRQVLVVDNASSGRRTVPVDQGFELRGHTLQGTTVSGNSFGSLEDFAPSARGQGSQRVVTQKKTLVTERVDSSSRA